MIDIQQYAPPVVATSAIRLAARLQLANRVDPVVNVIISNGSAAPLYLGRAKLDQYIPVSTIGEGMGLNITVHSYLDELTFGLVSCRELVPDLWHLVDLHIDEIDVLFKATGADYVVAEAGAARSQEGGCEEGSQENARQQARRFQEGGPCEEDHGTHPQTGVSVALTVLRRNPCHPWHLETLEKCLQRQVAGARRVEPVSVSGDRALGDAHLVDLVGAVGEAGPAGVLVHVGERGVGRVTERRAPGSSGRSLG